MAKRKQKKQFNALHLRSDDTGCGNIRMTLPGEALNKHTHFHVDQSMYLHTRDIVSQRWDVIVGQRICTPDGAKIWRDWLVHPDAAATILELDDNLFEIDPDNAQAYEAYTPQMLERLATSIIVSDALTVTTPYLAAELVELNANIFVLPNYLPKTLLAKAAPSNDGKVRIGWAGGSSHLLDLMRIVDPVNAFMAQNESAELIIYGQNFTKLFDTQNMTHKPWIKDQAGYMRGLHFDIGIAPLKGSRFDNSKSHLKALEYAFRGIPCIASNEIPYQSFIDHGVTGFLANTSEEWFYYLNLLANDASLRKKMGDSAFEKAKIHTLEANIDTRAQVYEEVIASKVELRRTKFAAVRL